MPQPFNPQSLNRYSYCLNNPLIYVDPSGHIPMDEFSLEEVVVTGSRRFWFEGMGFYGWVTFDEYFSLVSLYTTGEIVVGDLKADYIPGYPNWDLHTAGSIVSKDKGGKGKDLIEKEAKKYTYYSVKERKIGYRFKDGTEVEGRVGGYINKNYNIIGITSNATTWHCFSPCCSQRPTI